MDIDTVLIQKKSRRGGARPRNALGGVKSANDSQRWLIYELIRHYGGLAKITAKCGKILNDSDFSIQNFSNWRRRGYVPIQFAAQLGKDLGVSTHALNFVEATKILGPSGTWKQVVERCKIFDKKTRNNILFHREPKQ